MLKVTDLNASVGDKQILRGINLDIKPGEVHAIMGPNGSGKSTLGNVLAGRDGYEVDSGTVEYMGKDLFELDANERACEGLYLAFQYPVEIPGIANSYFLKAALNAQREYRGEDEIDALDFLELVREKMQLVELPDQLLHRPVNVGFSGGEKKRNEIFHMSVLEPKLAVLDETDSGLDIDALKTVANGVNSLRAEDRSFVVITHYQRLLDYIKPDFVHVLYKGQIIESGDFSLAKKLEAEGYGWLIDDLVEA